MHSRLSAHVVLGSQTSLLQDALQQQQVIVVRDVQVFIPDEQLPELPQELCGIWSYIQWEHAGCPNRSHQDNDAAYQQAIQVWPRLCNQPKSKAAWHKHECACHQASHFSSAGG